MHVLAKKERGRSSTQCRKQRAAPTISTTFSPDASSATVTRATNMRGLPEAGTAADKPLSRHKRAKAKAQNAVLGGIIGGGIGAIFGPAGVVAGSTIGAAIGHGQNPDRK